LACGTGRHRGGTADLMAWSTSFEIHEL
jgi:hypothetical protein